MKIATQIAATLFGFVVLIGGLFLFSGKMLEWPSMGEAANYFMAARGPSGCMALVKACEILAGVLVINILCFDSFVVKRGWSLAHVRMAVAAPANRTADAVTPQ